MAPGTSTPTVTGAATPPRRSRRAPPPSGAVANADDICPLDPADDSDFDGSCDSVDVCPGSDDRIDADLDGIPNGCDACSGPDTDGDGSPDDCDECPADLLDDSDGDGACDSADPCPADPLDDSDFDTACDSGDMCPGSDDRIDADLDGVADGCDVCPLDLFDDSDFDGTCDGDDACPGADDAADADGDGFADGCDACSPAPGDLDRDGLGDGAEVAIGTSATDPDSDEDGLGDGGDPDPLAPWDACSPWSELEIHAPDGVAGVALADLDGDGDLDVVVASENDDTIAWFANDGSGGFGPEQVLSSASPRPKAVATADLDGDGDLDVLATAYDDDMVAWFTNLGGGAFSARKILTTTADGAVDVTAADVDGDGDPDVIAVAEFDDQVVWLANLGGGVFSAVKLVIGSGVLAPRSAEAADFDADGDLDVLVASDGDDTVRWYTNDGAGGFLAAAPVTDDANAARTAVPADLDGDGDLDVLTAAGLDDDVAWYANLGGTWGPKQVVGAGADLANSAVAVDLDLDGDLDVAATSYNDDTVAWYPNRGDGTFSAEIVVSDTADGVRAVVAGDLDGDLDGDGFPDLVRGVFIGDDVTLHASPGTWGDPDADGLSTEAEVCATFTDPYAADSDLGGTADGNEVAMGTDPGVSGDDLRAVTPTAGDPDGDGLGDDCDACPADPGDDSDGDGSCDGADLCPGGDDALDADGDGAVDACDPCPVDYPDDADGDGRCDSQTDGSLVLVHQTASWLGEETLALYGLFAEDLGGLTGVADCWPLGEGPCVGALPPEGGFVELTVGGPAGAAWLDVGGEVSLGGITAYRVVDPLTGTPHWFGEGAGWLPGEALGATFTGGVWGDYAGVADVVTPAAMGVTAPDPGVVAHLVAGGALDLAWTPGGGGDVVLVVDAPATRRLYHLADDGHFALAVDDLGLDELDPWVSLTLGRWATDVTFLGGNRLELVARTEQPVTGRFVDVGGRVEIAPADTCGASVPVGPGAWWGDLSGAPAALDPGIAGCTGYAATGPEGRLAVTLAPGEALTATFDLLDADGALYVVEACADADTCAVGSDRGGAGATEALTYANTGATVETLYLILDSWDAGGDLFLLDVAIGPADAAPDLLDAADACGGAAVGAGTWLVDLAGATDDIAPAAGTCADIEPDGADVFVPVTVPAGHVLVASVDDPDAVVYATTVCGDATTCGDPAQDTIYVNDGPADVMVTVVVDGAAAAPPGLVTLDLALADAADALAGRARLDGAAGCAELAGLPDLAPGAWYGAFGDAPAELDPACAPLGADTREIRYPLHLAPGETLTATYGAPGDTAVLYVLADCADAGTCLDAADGGGVGVDAGLVYANLSDTAFDGVLVLDTRGAGATGAVYTLDVEIDGPTSLSDTCAGAAALGEGELVGDLAGLADDLAPAAGTCTPVTEDGADAFARVTIPPGELLTATVTASDARVYLLDSCADLGSCSPGSGTGAARWNAGPTPVDVWVVVDSAAADPAGWYGLALDLAPASLAGRTEQQPTAGCADAAIAPALAPGASWGTLAAAGAPVDPACATGARDALYPVDLAPGERLAASVDLLGGTGTIAVLTDCAAGAGCAADGAGDVAYTNTSAVTERVWLVISSDDATTFLLDAAVEPAYTTFAADTCDGAALLPPFYGAGWWVGDTTGLADDLDGAVCAGVTLNGPDLVAPVHLEPGDLLWVEPSAGVAWLAADCADASSCVSASHLLTAGGGDALFTLHTGPAADAYVILDATDAGGPVDAAVDVGPSAVLAPSDSCAALPPAIGAGRTRWTGDLTGFADHFDPDTAIVSCTGFAAPGADGVVPLLLQPGETVRADYKVQGDAPAADGALYLLSTCGDVDSCVAGDDDYSGTGPEAAQEAVFWTNATGAPVTRYLVLDGYADPGAFLLVIDIW